MPKIYLAGGIANLSGEQAIGWRERVTVPLLDLGFDVLDPMRAKDALRHHDKISSDVSVYNSQGIFFTTKGIMTRDFNDVKRADILLVNLLGAKQPSLGTTMEIAWAYALQKPVVVCIEEEGNPHDKHPMLHEAMPFRVTSLLAGVRSAAIIMAVAPPHYIDDVLLDYIGG